MIEFNGKTVWITGASSGIGKALALKINYLGANVVLSSRNKKELENVAKQCRIVHGAGTLQHCAKSCDIVHRAGTTRICAK